MKFLRLSCYVALLSVLFLSTKPLIAGPFSDDMAKCLVRSTTEADKTILIRWIFAAFSHNPKVENLAKISDQQKKDLNMAIAELFMRLTTEACKDETKTAYKNEGVSVFEKSFSALGSVAAQGLMSHPDVAKYTAGLKKYVDGWEQIYQYA